MEIKVYVPAGFELEKAVCNHGFFMMAPNRWMPSTKTLIRPLRLPDHRSVTVSIYQPPSATFLSINVLNFHEDLISFAHSKLIREQVTRMLRLSHAEEEQVKQFRRLHVDAANRGFGRLFRNPSLFEDLVKSLLLCATTFHQSLEMAEALCIFQKRLNLEKGVVDPAKRGRKRKQSSSGVDVEQEFWGNFPSAEELALLKEDQLYLLYHNCKLKYRAKNVLSLARKVTNGEINLMDLEKLCDGNEVYRKLMGINGFGEFVASNALMCMGFYHKIPSDSETVRLIKEVHKREDCEKKNKNAMAKEIYDKYAPFQTIAYWLELVENYEKKLGKLSLLDRSSYKNAAGSAIDN